MSAERFVKGSRCWQGLQHAYGDKSPGITQTIALELGSETNTVSVTHGQDPGMHTHISRDKTLGGRL